MSFIVWDRKNQVKIPHSGTFPTSQEANAWIRRNAAKSSHKQNDSVIYDVIDVNVQ